MSGNLKTSIYATASLTGTIIGVGFFALPFIAKEVGILTMSIYFLILGFFIFLIHYFYAEVSLNTPDFLRLPGYAKIYLGEWARKLIFFNFVLGSVGSLLAYLIVGGEFLTNLVSGFFGGNTIFYTFLYFAVGALLILMGMRAIAKIEFWGLAIFFIVLIFLFTQGFHFFRFENLFVGSFSIKEIFLPFGPVIFSLWGATMVPELEEMLIGNKRVLKKVIFISLLIAAVVYAVFTFFILGISGSQTTESALSGLTGFLGKNVLSIGFAFGVLATFTSFIAIGLSLKNMLFYDFKLPQVFSWSIAVFSPFILFLAGTKNFINVISFIGAFSLGLEGTLILLTYKKIKKAKYKFFIYPLIIVLIGGIIYELVIFIK